MTPVGGLSTGLTLSAVPPRIKPIRFRLSPLESRNGLVPDQSLGLDRVSTFRSSLHSSAARAHLRSRCGPHVRGVADVASVTTSCSPGVRRTGADLRHLSRPGPRIHSLRPQSRPLVRGPHRESGLLDCRTVRLEAPTGVSFRLESLSMPEKGLTRSPLDVLTVYGDGLSPCRLDLT